jgi:hypothetical protein
MLGLMALKLKDIKNNLSFWRRYIEIFDNIKDKNKLGASFLSIISYIISNLFSMN